MLELMTRLHLDGLVKPHHQLLYKSSGAVSRSLRCPNRIVMTAFIGLSIVGTLFSALSALFGAYTILFVLAIWSTFRNRSAAITKLRTITIILFFFESTHYVSRCVMYSQRRSVVQPQDSPFNPAFSIPVLFVGGLATTIAGLLSDGLLAWRFSVIFGGAKWALYIPATAVIVNALLGLSGDLQIFAFYEDIALFQNHIYGVEFKINAAWGWMMFATNTILTGLIIARIIYVSNQLPSRPTGSIRNDHYSTLVAAIVESGFITWVGLLLYGVATIAPTGHITTDLNVGFVMICIIPIFFGISQCLLIVRLSLSTSIPAYTANLGATTDSQREGLGIRIQCDVHTDAKSTSSADESLKETNVVDIGFDGLEKASPCV